MFNWFKKKIELKNDKCIMSSLDYKKGVKLGTEITVPEYFKCVIYFKGKVFNCLDAGKHKVDKESFAKLISHQQNSKNKLKRVKFVAHYISTSTQKLEFKYKRQKYIAHFGITDTQKFCELMLLYAYKVDKDYASEYLIDIFKELLLFIKSNFNCVSHQLLKQYGITIESLAPTQSKSSLFNNNVKIQSSNTSHLDTNSNTISSTQTNSSYNTQPPQNNSDAKDTKSLEPNLNSQPFPKCPKCGNATKFNTAYCLRCGYKLQ